MTRLVPEIRFRLRIVLGDDIAIGPGKIDLLEAIGANGLDHRGRQGARHVVPRAWLLVDTMNRCFESPVVTTEAGGAPAAARG